MNAGASLSAGEMDRGADRIGAGMKNTASSQSLTNSGKLSGKGISFRAQWETLVERPDRAAGVRPQMEGDVRARPAGEGQAMAKRMPAQRVASAEGEDPAHQGPSPLQAGLSKSGFASGAGLQVANTLESPEKERTAGSLSDAEFIPLPRDTRRGQHAAAHGRPEMQHAAAGDPLGGAIAQPQPNANIEFARPAPGIVVSSTDAAQDLRGNPRPRGVLGNAAASHAASETAMGAKGAGPAAALSKARSAAGADAQMRGAPSAAETDGSAGAEVSGENLDDPCTANRSVARPVGIGDQPEDRTLTAGAKPDTARGSRLNVPTAQGLEADQQVTANTAGSHPEGTNAANSQAAEASSGDSRLKGLENEAVSAAREKVEREVNQPGLHGAAEQTTVTPIDLSKGARIPDASWGTGGETAGCVEPANRGPSSLKTGSTVGETFAAMDKTSGTTPNWIHASSQSAEAGFQDAALGWVGVRASLSGGEVRAALVSSSTHAAQMLSAHLPGLTAHLSEERVPVAAVTIAASGEGGLGPGVQQGMHQNEQQRDSPSGRTTAAEADEQGSGRSLAPEETQAGREVELGSVTWLSPGSGSRISVMV
jgi:flagellar hook-length control protein FliK